MQARGSIGNTLIFSNWKGRSTLKFSPKVSNPKTAPQVGRRAMLRFLATSFASLSTADIATWLPLALNGEISTYNAWVAYNMNRWGRFLAPTMAYPATEATDADNIGFASCFALKRSARCKISPSGIRVNFGYLVYRSTSPGFTPALTDCVRVGLWINFGSPNIDWIDGPLKPDTYYYRLDMFSKTGKFGGTYTTQHTVIIS